ncbi:MAG TPA: hypothetical protein PKD25_09060 [Rubrivivax sp.]|nr:hypothetical protein [Rubrivivax sp.]
MSARGFIGAGDVWLNRIDPDTGLHVGWVGPLEASKFAIKSNAELKELESKGRDSYGQVIESVPLQRPAEFSMTLREANKENITLMFMGEQSVLNQGSGSVTDESITLKAGYGSRLAFENIATAGFVLTSDPAGTTYVLNTDYTVNYRLGIVTAVPGSALATAVAGAGAGGLDLLVDYSYTAITGTRVQGAVQPQLRAWIKFDGKNFADGAPVIAEIHEAILTPEAEFDFLADDWNELPLQGRLKTPTGKSEPFVVDFRA